ncbi:hypothetical protein [Saccharothrix xinjiangensis]|uniref:Uncharacterized protein n=1 Tax=Saccharothrix xinjiangensis TaxID=204798 RepID=A0ABV9Y459_9PSEU
MAVIWARAAVSPPVRASRRSWRAASVHRAVARARAASDGVPSNLPLGEVGRFDQRSQVGGGEAIARGGEQAQQVPLDGCALHQPLELVLHLLAHEVRVGEHLQHPDRGRVAPTASRRHRRT